jgi:Rrf2 family protein
MILTKETDYALRLLNAIDEGCGAKPLSLHSFAQDADISFLFLQRIASKLKKVGLIRARKGKVGGYWLSKPRHTISTAQVIEAIEGNVFECSDKTSVCLHQELKSFFANKYIC